MKQSIFAACLSLAALLVAGDGYASEDKIGVMSGHPSLSPSGQEMVFEADFDGPTRLWTAAVDGSRLRKVSSASNASTSITDTEPTWSPDGRTIAYTSIEGTSSDIWLVQADGTNQHKLTDNGASNTSAAWSPDGRRIAFVSDKDGTNDIWIMNADGSQQFKLVNSNDQENNPCFSPDGNQLVFSRTQDDASVLMIINVDGSGLKTLTAGNFHDWEPDWGSGGIVFTSNRGASDRWKIWRIQPDGSGLRKVGDVAGHFPVWMPDGRIVFTDESMPSRALAAVSILNPATGAKQVVVDVQGYFTPVDIRPGKTPNRINPNSAGKVAIAILSTRSFDAAKAVDRASLTFGKTGAENTLAACSKTFKDVNGDGLPDLVCRFAVRSAGFRMGDTTGVLRFTDMQGMPYEGRDTIATVQVDDPDDFKD